MLTPLTFPAARRKLLQQVKLDTQLRIIVLGALGEAISSVELCHDHGDQLQRAHSKAVLRDYRSLRKHILKEVT
jgi:hypothetical protein